MSEPLIAVVTGAGSGIGAETAVGFGREGYRVVAVDLNEASVLRVAEKIRSHGAMADPFTLDIADTTAVAATAERVERTVGRPTVLVNCAGWDEIGSFIDTDPAFWTRVIEINLRGAIATVHGFYHQLIATRGRIVNVASDAGRVGSSGETVYAGAKAGVIGFTKSIARELARYEVTANCVCPGPINTPFLDKNTEKLRQALVRAIPMRRIGEPSDVWHAIRYFASPGAAYVTGQVLSVSGGLTMSG